ncbi:MAG: hypothetical protein JO354_03280 [Verrucomicrobia bacterium]|nr:hypothetical protein [Verrucomicrobiota bacterium]
MRNVLVALLLSTAAAFAQNNPTAYDALRVVGNQLDRNVVDRIISVVGVDGNPQPRTWRILISESRGMREIFVTDGRVTKQGPYSGSLAGSERAATIDTSKLNLDSSGAYEVASKTADTSHVPFALVNYTLRTDDRGNPTWVVTLQNQNHHSLGTIYIGANRGTVTRTEGMFQGLPRDEVVEDQREGNVQDDETGGSNNPIVARAREMFYRARDNAQETFKRVRRNFADFIRGDD